MVVDAITVVGVAHKLSNAYENKTTAINCTENMIIRKRTYNRPKLKWESSCRSSTLEIRGYD